MAIPSKIYLIICYFLSLGLCSFNDHNCDFSVNLKQELHNDGFHRNMTYGVKFFAEKSGADWIYDHCVMGLEQELPPGVFVNPDELSDLQRAGRTNAITRTKVNVEASADYSYISHVYLIDGVLSTEINLWVPVHARYHKVMPGGGSVRNEINGPKLYVRCPDDRLQECGAPLPPTASFLCEGGPSCDWRHIPYIMISDPLLWRVPVGNSDMYYSVSIGTVIVVVLGSLYLLMTIHEYKVHRR